MSISKTININKKVKINPQNTNGKTILGIRFPKKDLMSHTLPNNSAPDNIKNKSTPILKKLSINAPINQFKE